MLQFNYENCSLFKECKNINFYDRIDATNNKQYIYFKTS